MPRRRARIDLEYDGTDFAGWQRQPRRRTIQGQLEHALHTATKLEIPIVGAGRTDAGVHARGQVAHADLPADTDLHRLTASLNGLSGDGIVVHRIRWAPVGFDARRSATARSYRYRLTDHPVALERQYVWQTYPGITYRLLRQAAESLPGEHDFVSFCVSKSAPKGTMCRIIRADWRRRDAEFRFTITANRFVHGMVRSLVGTMVEVARGRLAPEDFARLLRVRDRRAAGPTAPAHGLCLMNVDY